MPPLFPSAPPDPGSALRDLPREIARHKAERIIGALIRQAALEFAMYPPSHDFAAEELTPFRQYLDLLKEMLVAALEHRLRAHPAFLRQETARYEAEQAEVERAERLLQQWGLEVSVSVDSSTVGQKHFVPAPPPPDDPPGGMWK